MNFLTLENVFAIAFYLFMSVDVVSSISTIASMNINMPDVTARVHDSYICTAKKLNSAESYIVRFEPDADSSKAHHMMLFGCKGLSSQDQLYPGHWECSGEFCHGMTIIYGWAKDAPAMKLPPRVGHLVGGNSSIQYLILQLHYTEAFPDGVTDNSGLKLHMTTERQPYVTGIYLLMAPKGMIAPNRPRFSIDVNCQFRNPTPIHVFAYRVHTHSLGTMVVGYKYSRENSSWTLLARGNPQWPQAFYPVEHPQTITSHDILASRCIYNSSRVKGATYIGSMATDEMCNLYLMYYTEYQSASSDQIPSCVGIEYSSLPHELPSLSSDLLPSKYSFAPELPIHKNSFVNDSPHPDTSEEKNNNFAYKMISGWPSPHIQLGQVTAVALDNKDNVVIFHRGKHVWNELSFDDYDRYLLENNGPISIPTILAIHPVTGLVIYAWGKSLFFMPHGLSIDPHGNFWVTDVALHQVFKFSANDHRKPSLVLGQRFVPGSGKNQFCKPTSVAVSSKEEIYVADGYCNARIMKFSSSGKFIAQWGEQSNIFDRHPSPGTFNLPHKVVLLEDRSMFCVADRVNARIQCFSMEGEFKFLIQRDEFGGSLFSVSYAKSAGLLFAICGEAIDVEHQVKGFIFNVTNQELLATFTTISGSFKRPHDIVVTADGEDVYVCEIGPNAVWKFVKEYHKSSKKVLADDISTHQKLAPISSWTEAQNHEPALNIVEDDSKNFETSIVIMALLGIPILLLILITVIIRLRRRGKLQGLCFGHLKGWMGGYRTPHPQEKFNLGNFLNPHKGFDKVAVVESDADEDGAESETEEFGLPTTKNA